MTSRVLIVQDGGQTQVIDASDTAKLRLAALAILSNRFNTGSYREPVPFPEFGVPDEVMATYTGANSLEHIMLRSWERHKQEAAEHAVYSGHYRTMAAIVAAQDGEAALSCLLYPPDLGPYQPPLPPVHLVRVSDKFLPPATNRPPETPYCNSASHGETNDDCADTAAPSQAAGL